MDLLERTQGKLKIRISGIGGQGAVLLGDVLGHAASLDGLQAAGSTVYGSQARGGASRSDLILSRTLIDFPHVTRPHVLVALAQPAYQEDRSNMDRPAAILYDDYHVTCDGKDDPSLFLSGVPATRTMLAELGTGQPANFYMLGVLVGLLGIVGLSSLQQAMASQIQKRHLEMNLKALGLGLERGEKLVWRFE